MNGLQKHALLAVVLVEGVSDQVALETLARRLGRDLAGEGVSVVPMGGAHAIGRFLTRFASESASVRLAGLYDIGEEGIVGRALERAGLISGSPTRADLERLGFYVCDSDLEDELIRALGTQAVEAVVAAQGEIDSFRTLQKQPEWRGRPIDAQLRRFLGNSSRKITYAALLADALDLSRVPRPLRLVLSRV